MLRMYRHARPAVVSILTVLGAVPGCAGNGDPLTPNPGVAGSPAVYVLRSVAGHAPPVVWVTNESVTITVQADTIRFFGGGLGGRVVIQRYDEAGQSEPTVRRETAEFEVLQRADRVELSFVCPDLAQCLAAPHFTGRVTANELIFDQALNYLVPLRYERVKG